MTIPLSDHDTSTLQVGFVTAVHELCDQENYGSRTLFRRQSNPQADEVMFLNCTWIDFANGSSVLDAISQPWKSEDSIFLFQVS